MGWMSAAPSANSPGAIINLPAVIIVLCIMYLLVVGIRESARFNAVMVGVKLAAVVFFIGAGAVVLPGRHIGAGAVVGAGSVVIHDVPEGLTVAGNPAREIKRS